MSQYVNYFLTFILKNVTLPVLHRIDCSISHKRGESRSIHGRHMDSYINMADIMLWIVWT